MKKIIYLMTLLSVFLLISSLGPSIQVKASTVWNNDYVFDAVSTTSNGVSLTIDEGTNVFTLNGSATGTTYYEFFDMLTPNSNGSVLDALKTYYVYYEYISGTFSGVAGIVTPFRIAEANEKGHNSMNLRGYNNESTNVMTYDKNLGFVFSFNATTPVFQMRTGFHNGSTWTTANQLKYRLTIKEVNPEVRTMDMFGDLNSSALNGVSITHPTVNRLNIHGTIGTAGTMLNIFDNLSTQIVENTNPIIIYFKKISGTTNDTGGIIINGRDGNSTQMYRTEYGSFGVIVDKVVNMQFRAALFNKVFENYLFEVFVQEIEIEIAETPSDPEPSNPGPGDSTTPPSGVSLYTSHYQGLIYYNAAEDLPQGSYYVATSEGATFDFNILTEQLIFTIEDGVTFKVNYGVDLYHEYLGPADIVISTIGNSIRVRRVVGLQETFVYTYDSTNPSEAIASFVFIFASSPVIEVDVSFFDEDGMTLLDSGIYEPGDLIVAPSDPSKSGYIFVGWENSDGNMWNFETDTVGEDPLDLYAKYVAEETPQHTVTFVSNGGSSVYPSLVYEGATLVIPVPTRSGYTFAGWYIDEELTLLFATNTPVTEDMTLYAKWIPSGGGGIVTPPPTGTSSSTTYIIIAVVLIILVLGVLSSKKKG